MFLLLVLKSHRRSWLVYFQNKGRLGCSTTLINALPSSLLLDVIFISEPFRITMVFKKINKKHYYFILLDVEMIKYELTIKRIVFALTLCSPLFLFGASLGSVPLVRCCLILSGLCFLKSAFPRWTFLPYITLNLISTLWEICRYVS
jgi:hypothetical protein